MKNNNQNYLFNLPFVTKAKIDKKILSNHIAKLKDLMKVIY